MKIELKRCCYVCGKTEGIRKFAITVDGHELRASQLLCQEHGDLLLLALGVTTGAFLREHGDLMGQEMLNAAKPPFR